MRHRAYDGPSKPQVPQDGLEDDKGCYTTPPQHQRLLAIFVRPEFNPLNRISSGLCGFPVQLEKHCPVDPTSLDTPGHPADTTLIPIALLMTKIRECSLVDGIKGLVEDDPDDRLMTPKASDKRRCFFLHFGISLSLFQFFCGG